MDRTPRPECRVPKTEEKTFISFCHPSPLSPLPQPRLFYFPFPHNADSAVEKEKGRGRGRKGEGDVCAGSPGKKLKRGAGIWVVGVENCGWGRGVGKRKVKNFQTGLVGRLAIIFFGRWEMFLRV